MITSDSQAKAILDEIRVKLNNPTEKHAQRLEIWGNLHALAEMEYQPAFELLVKGLDDQDPAWRYVFLRNLGFHYDTKDIQPYLSKFHALLLDDPDEDVRRTAASIVGSIGTWPDHALLVALENDQVAMVRETAFEELLMQMGVPMPSLRELRHELRSRGKDVSLDALKEIAQQNGKSIVLANGDK